ncbi:MAG: enoyl-CoA hydratase/isomerase family protein [Endozoicomonas sp.]
MELPTILWEQDGPLVRLTLNRPEAANAMDLQMMKDLLDAAIECEDNDNIRAVLLTGSGKMFTPGGDLGWLARNPDSVSTAIKQSTAFMNAAIARFVRMPKPLVTCINGHAAGAGIGLAVMGDYIVCAESARISPAFTAAGLSPDGGTSYFLPRLIGQRRAKELFLTNRSLTAEEALEWGLINAVAPDAEALKVAEDMALKLANGATRAYGTVKTLLNSSDGNSLETHLHQEISGIAGNAASADGREGIAAFMEKRRPEFSGK